MVSARISSVRPVLSLAYLLLSVAPASAQAPDTQPVYSEDQLSVAPLVLRERRRDIRRA